MILFLALCFIGVAIAGASAFVIFWPLTLVHVRDRHAGTAADFGPGAFANPAALRWLLGGGYRATGDRSLSGLATPARIALLTVIVALVLAGLLWLAAEALP
ncbi:hypothetical protein [Pseudoxanthomonas suwonensis]|uniref:Membrane protein n=1 Tax=Pseudoxanthomonas suwonensis TaxID=314722 RepID=A0A0E3Z2Q5_9GAMM|nr:hypothetical protein [Pseudoxanthomonas suwonensis]AKC87882.1 membrane protein [Pseudoxanthomonas suwonensis]